MQATRRRTQEARDLQLSSIASAPEESVVAANPSAPAAAADGEAERRNRNGNPPWASGAGLGGGD